MDCRLPSRRTPLRNAPTSERLAGIAAVVSNFNAMRSLDGDLIHFLGDRLIPVSCQTVDTGSDQEVRPDLRRSAEQFVDVAFAITDMDAPSRLFQKLSRLASGFPTIGCFPSSRWKLV